MDKFNILKIDLKTEEETRGSKSKYWSLVNDKSALIKINNYYKGKDTRSWNVSEKLYSEISKYLGFSCVNIDFIQNENNLYGIASYDYKNNKMYNILSGDELFFSVFHRMPKKSGDKEKKIIKEEYTYSNILKILEHYSVDINLVRDFNRIMIIDALTGECDRHYENWGIYLYNSEYKLLPAYDNSTCLLHLYREEEKIERDKMCETKLLDYSKKSRCKISVGGKIYSHFDFIDYLLNNSNEEQKECLIKDIKKLINLTDEYINDLVNKVPDCLCTKEHKLLIIKYIIIRRDILLSKVV